MRILLIGSAGHVGSAVRGRLAHDHEMVVANRSSGVPVDVTDPESITAMFEQVCADGTLDAIVTTLGSAPFKPLEELARADYLTGLKNKAVGQVEVVRQGVEHLADGGSFTLTTGVVGREQIRTGVAAAMANGALEYFVPAAAAELPRGLRINAVSPTVLIEAPGYHPSFPGFIPVAAATVAEAYARSVEGIQTGRIFIVD